MSTFLTITCWPDKEMATSLALDFLLRENLPNGLPQTALLSMISPSTIASDGRGTWPNF